MASAATLAPSPTADTSAFSAAAPNSLDRLLDATPDVIARFDRALRHVYVNEAVQRITGLPPSAFLGKTNEELGMPESLCALWREELLRVFERGEERSFEFEFRDGRSVRRFHARVVPELVDGEILTAIAVTRDITDLRPAVERAEATEAERRARVAAERGSAQQARLLSVAQRVARATTESEVADAVVVEGAEALQAANAGLWLVEPGSDQARLVQSFRYTDALHAAFSTVPFDLDLPLSRALGTGEPQWFETREHYAQAFERAEQGTRALPGLSIQSFACLPLGTRGRPVGALAVGFDDHRILDPDERRFLLTLAGLAANSIDRVRLHNRLERLQRITAALAAAMTLEDVGRTATEVVVEVLGLTSAGLWMADARGDLRLVHTGGEPGITQHYSRLPEDSPLPAVTVLRTGEPLWVETEEEYRRASPELAERSKAAGRMMAFAVLPLTADRRAFGVMSLSHRGWRRFTDDQRSFLSAIAAQCAQALDRARSLSAERRATERLDLLARAGALLSTSLDLDETLRALARLSVPTFADWCAVDLVDGERIQRIAVHHRDPARTQLGYELLRRYPICVDDVSATAAAIASKRTHHSPVITDDALRAVAYDAEHLAVLRTLGVSSSIVAPLILDERAIGAVSFVWAESGRSYDESDVALAEELARRASVAVGNSRLFAAERRARLRIGRMQEVTAALSRARTTAEVAEAACRIGSDAMEAHSGALWLLEADGSLSLAGTWGTDDRFMEQFRVIPADAKETPAVAVVQSGEPVWVETEDDYRRQAPELFERAKAAGHLAAYGAVPITIDGRLAGVMAFAHPIGHAYDDADRGFYVALAQHCSQALDRARLLDIERRSNECLRILAAAGEALAQSLDVDEILRAVCAITVPAFADWCVIDLVEGTELRRAVFWHSDPERVRFAEEVARRYPVRVGDGSPVAQVIATGDSRFHPRLAVEVLRAAARDDDEFRLLREAGLVSAILVPLVARNERIGVVSFTTTESGRTFDEGDLRTAEEFGRRAGLAIANARLYRAARDARSRAEEANRIKDEFLATVSHELRTPLNAITGWSALLAEKVGDAASVAKGLEVIRRNADAQTKIVEDILDVSRIITGKLKIDPRPVDMIAILREALEVVRPSADAKGIEMRFEVAPGAVCLLVGDAQRLQQAVWNLLSNAIKFTPPSGRITASVAQEGASVRVTVSDTGRGIEADFLPYVFERFRQADSSTTRKFGGLGLGLAIVRHIVELHGGSICAESPGVEKGATFRIVLPVRAIAMPPPAEEERPSRPYAHAVARDAADLAGVRVLVIDDEPDARHLVETVLARAGALVETAASAREGLTAVTRFRPEVIVSDIGMPDEDGYTFVGQLRQRAPADGGAIPAIALTAYARTEDRVRAITSGFTTHVTKPVDPSELVAIVAGVRRNAKMR